MGIVGTLVAAAPGSTTLRPLLKTWLTIAGSTIRGR